MTMKRKCLIPEIYPQSEFLVILLELYDLIGKKLNLTFREILNN